MRGAVPPSINMVNICRSALPFVALQFIGLVLVVAFTQIILLCPALIFGMG